MADAKEDISQQQHHVTIETPKALQNIDKEVEGVEEKPQKKTKTKRVASLDIFRGLTVAVQTIKLLNQCSFTL